MGVRLGGVGGVLPWELRFCMEWWTKNPCEDRFGIMGKAFIRKLFNVGWTFKFNFELFLGLVLIKITLISLFIIRRSLRSVFRTKKTRGELTEVKLPPLCQAVTEQRPKQRFGRRRLIRGNQSCKIPEKWKLFTNPRYRYVLKLHQCAWVDFDMWTIIVYHVFGKMLSQDGWGGHEYTVLRNCPFT